jgi:hypothetical protein
MDILVLQSMLLTVAMVENHGMYQLARPWVPPKDYVALKYNRVDLEVDGKK